MKNLIHSRIKTLRLKTLLLSLILSLGLLPLASKSEVKQINCDDKMTQRDINGCAYDQFKEADKELNRLYNILISRTKNIEMSVPQSAKNEKLRLADKLKQSQRLWIKFRDAECEIAIDIVEGGTMAPLLYSNCLTRMTLKRNEELRAYTDCQEYDFSCPFPVPSE